MVLTYFSLLMPAFALLAAPIDLAIYLLRYENAPLPFLRILSFGGILEPRYIICATAFDQ